MMSLGTKFANFRCPHCQTLLPLFVMVTTLRNRLSMSLKTGAKGVNCPQCGRGVRLVYNVSYAAGATLHLLLGMITLAIALALLFAIGAVVLAILPGAWGIAITGVIWVILGQIGSMALNGYVMARLCHVEDSE
jgi:hypothetical protein